MGNDIFLEERLQKIVDVAPFITQLVSDEDIMVAITDTEKYVYFSPSESLNAGIKIGDPFLEYDVFGNIMKIKKRHVQVSPPEYGPAFKAIGIPIYNDKGDLIGALAFGISLKKEYELLDMFKILEKLGANIQDKSHALLSQTEELSATLDEISINSKEVHANSEKIDDIVTFINKIAQQSNLLGLNAAIEAARAGQHGKTFSVVAQEIRKLSSDSANATTQIGQSLGGIQDSIEEMTIRLVEIAQAVQLQAKEAEYFAEAVEDLGKLNAQIKNFIEIFTK